MAGGGSYRAREGLAAPARPGFSRMKLVIGSRGSRLAVTQAAWVGAHLKEKYPDLQVEFKEILTTGDLKAQSALKEMGGKGVFVKEIEEALLQGGIDLAVHSLKDLP